MTGHRIAEARFAAALAAAPVQSGMCPIFWRRPTTGKRGRGELSKKEALSEMLRAAAACLGLRLACRPTLLTR